jgi:hypothetical protein
MPSGGTNRILFCVLCATIMLSKQICALTMQAQSLQNKEPHQYIRRGSFQLTDTK